MPVQEVMVVLVPVQKHVLVLIPVLGPVPVLILDLVDVSVLVLFFYICAWAVDGACAIMEASATVLVLELVLLLVLL